MLRDEFQIIEADEAGPRFQSVAYLFDEMATTDRIWIARVLGEIVGGLRLTLDSGATGLEQVGANVVIHTVSVHEPYQGRGYGRALMQFAEQWVQTKPGLPNTLSLAVEADNAVAIGLYESLGYRFVDVRGEPLRTSDLRCFVMAKGLSD